MRLNVFRTCGAAACLLATAVGAAAQQRVQFPSADSELTGGAPTQLEGYVFRPEGTGPFPAVVAMHGCGGLYMVRDRTRLTARNIDWGRRLAGAGYVVLFPDSFNPRGVPEICRDVMSKVRSGVHRVADAYGALAWLQQQTDVRPGAVALLGWSNGGGTTVWASRLGTRARPKVVKTDFALGIAMYPRCTAILKVKYRPAFPLHLFVGDKDDWTPAGPCKAFAEKAGVPIVAYPNAHHGFDAPNQPKLVLTGIRSTESGTATVGTDPEARADVIRRVPEILAAMKGR